MRICRPCRHDNHAARKKQAYRTGGCGCKACGPHPNKEARLR